MLEIQLQQLWHDKRLPFHDFRLTNDQPIQIIQSGIWNTFGSGPDFQFAQMRYDNLVWFGSIEFHLKSSDWYRHHHDSDKAYENVILHVVLEHDQPVYLNERILPTLELKSYLKGEFKIPPRYQWNKASPIRCISRLKEFQREQAQMQLRTLQNRLHRKFMLDQDPSTRNLRYYQLISKAFGTKTNSLSFELLTQQITLVDHLTLSEHEILTMVCSNYQGWKHRNLSMSKTLTKRILSWTKFMRWFAERKETNPSFISIELGFQHAGITNPLLQKNLLINVKTYLLMEEHRLHNRTSSGILQAMNFLKSIAPESNRINRLWKYAGIEAKNAFESQANLEIYQQFCTNNKCLNCCVGQQLLKS